MGNLLGLYIAFDGPRHGPRLQQLQAGKATPDSWIRSVMAQQPAPAIEGIDGSMRCTCFGRVEVSLPLSPPLVGGFQIFFFNMFHS